MLRMTSLTEWTWRWSGGVASYRYSSLIPFIHRRKERLGTTSLCYLHRLCFPLARQRIALVYFVVALIEAFTRTVRPTTVRSGPYAIFDAYRWQWYINLAFSNWVHPFICFGPENAERFCCFLKTDRLGGFIAFFIYMVTTFSLYVPDWSFVYHNDGDVNDGKKFMVSRTCQARQTIITEGFFVFDAVLGCSCRYNVVWGDTWTRPVMQLATLIDRLGVSIISTHSQFGSDQR